MGITIDCGEGKHDLCVGTGRHAYMFPQEDDPDGFSCGCSCHHGGLYTRDADGNTVRGNIRGVPCRQCAEAGVS